MKKFVAVVCILASTAGLVACAGEGNVETQAPYAQDRTAGEGGAYNKADGTYNRAQRK